MQRLTWLAIFFDLVIPSGDAQASLLTYAKASSENNLPNSLNRVPIGPRGKSSKTRGAAHAV
jgi:hypothetical protein